MATRAPRATAVAERDDDKDGGDKEVARRVCGEAGCTTVLSQYNATSWCGLHSRRDWRANREPRRRAVSAAGGENPDW